MPSRLLASRRCAMADDDDEFGFADDLDALPDHALRDLETQALLSTQHRRPAHPPSSDYGFDTEDVVNRDEDVVATAAAPRAADESQPYYQHRLDRYAGRHRGSVDAAGESAPAESRAGASDLAELQKRIRELENERDGLLQSVEVARRKAFSKAGETSIVRRNCEKLIKEYETRITLMKKSNAEVVAKQTAELETAKRDREKVQTDNKFLEHDLKHDAARVRQGRGRLKDGTGNVARARSAAVTPRKDRVAPFGDGFDDDDVVMVSPSKARSKASTPKQGSKRKRTAGEPSPGRPLPLSEPAPPIPLDGSMTTEAQGADIHEDVLAEMGRDDVKFKFLKRLMNHRPSGRRERTFEAFTKLAFPSASARSLSSIIYDGLALYHDEADDLPMYFCQILLSVWEQCLQESYFPPLHLIIDSLQFILAFQPLEKAASLTDTVVPLILSSAELVAIPPGQSLNNHAIQLYDPAAASKFREHIDLLECLSLLLAIARSCANSQENSVRFWQRMRPDFVLLMLMKTQPLPVIHLTLQLLMTSATPTSFGAIIPASTSSSTPPTSSDQQITTSTSLFDRLTTLLTDPPLDATTHKPPRTPLLWALRLSLVHLFAACLPSPYAATTLATHHLFIGRLITLLSTAISTLYTTNPRTPLHDTLTETINLTTRIAYALFTGPNTASLIDRRVKLAAVPGGGHKHLVALTRLAFVEAGEDEDGGGARQVGVVLETGIDEEVADMAHSLLDEFVSPEEGEMLLQVFSPRRSSAG